MIQCHKLNTAARYDWVRDVYSVRLWNSGVDFFWSLARGITAVYLGMESYIDSYSCQGYPPARYTGRAPGSGIEVEGGNASLGGNVPFPRNCRPRYEMWFVNPQVIWIWKAKRTDRTRMMRCVRLRVWSTTCTWWTKIRLSTAPSVYSTQHITRWSWTGSSRWRTAETSYKPGRCEHV